MVSTQNVSNLMIGPADRTVVARTGGCTAHNRYSTVSHHGADAEA